MEWEKKSQLCEVAVLSLSTPYSEPGDYDVLETLHVLSCVSLYVHGGKRRSGKVKRLQVLRSRSLPRSVCVCVCVCVKVFFPWPFKLLDDTHSLFYKTDKESKLSRQVWPY